MDAGLKYVGEAGFKAMMEVICKEFMRKKEGYKYIDDKIQSITNSLMNTSYVFKDVDLNKTPDDLIKDVELKSGDICILRYTDNNVNSYYYTKGNWEQIGRTQIFVTSISESSDSTVPTTKAVIDFVNEAISNKKEKIATSAEAGIVKPSTEILVDSETGVMSIGEIPAGKIKGLDEALTNFVNKEYLDSNFYSKSEINSLLILESPAKSSGEVDSVEKLPTGNIEIGTVYSVGTDQYIYTKDPNGEFYSWQKIGIDGKTALLSERVTKLENSLNNDPYTFGEF